MSMPVHTDDLAILSLVESSHDWHLRYILEAASREGLYAVVYNPQDLVILTSAGRPPMIVHRAGYEIRPGAILNRALNSSSEELLCAAEIMGIPTVNRAIPCRLATNKLISSLLFSASGLKVPTTAFSRAYEANARDLSTLLGKMVGLPAVTKPLTGSLGRMVQRQDDANSLTNYISRRQRSQYPLHVQEYLEHHGRDIRVTVIGSRVAGVIERVAPPGTFVTNMARGAKARALPITPEIEKVSIAAAQAVDLDLAGVDLIQNEAGYSVLEANACPNFDNTVRVAGFNIGGILINYLKAAIEGRS